MCNNGYALNYSEDNFGVFDRFMNPKYIFGVYAALIRDYREAVFVKQWNAPCKPWLFEFKRPDSVLLANWSADPQGGAALYAAHSDTGNAAKRIDQEGTATPLPLQNGVALFPVGPIGSTLQINGTTRLDRVEIAALPTLPDAIILGMPADGKLLLANPWRQEIVCTVTPRLPSGARITGLPENLRLKSGQTVTLPFALLCNAETARLAIDLKFGDCAPAAVSVPLRTARLAPNAAFSRRPADFQLRDYAQMECTFEFDPAIAGTLWRGPDDLSADVWLGRNGDRFELLARVRDDRHCPSPDPDQLWQGDSVQFALDFPGQNGHFELGGGLNAQGTPAPDCWIVPQGFDIAAVRRALNVKIERSGDLLDYRFSIPLPALGVTPEKMAGGFRFNLLVNDNDDGKERKCFLRIAPGIGTTQSMAQSPMVICR